MSVTESRAIDVSDTSHHSNVEREFRGSDYESSTSKSDWYRPSRPRAPYVGENQSAHNNGAVVSESRPVAFRPYVYEENAPTIEPIQRGGVPARYGGRSTPVARHYQYQSSSNETQSYLTEPDGLARSHHTVHSYVAVNPFSASIVHSLVNIGVHSGGTSFHPQGYPRPATPLPQSSSGFASYGAAPPGISKYLLAFCFDTIPRQIYLHLLLRLPSLYFSRVARIFEDAELSMPDIKKMALTSANDWKRDAINNAHPSWNYEPSIVSPSFSSLKASWQGFIDSLMREWKTLNIVSVLLLSAILTTLQIEDAAAQPVTRYSALMSLVCALMSLLYGCMYIIRFGTMKKTHKAAEWAAEAQKTRTNILWNVWVLLAMPSIWLSWSIIFYLACIMSFIWLTGSPQDPIINLSPRMILGPRIAITIVFVLGLVYLFLIASTFSRYGDAMDRAWRNRVLGWAENSGSLHKAPSSVHPRFSMNASEHEDSTPPSVPFPLPPLGYPEPRVHNHLRPQGAESDHSKRVGPLPNIVAPPSFSRQPPDPPVRSPLFRTVKILDLRFQSSLSNEMPETLLLRDIHLKDWNTFIFDASQAWDGQYPPYQKGPGHLYEPTNVVRRALPQDAVAQFIEWWNEMFFRPRGAQAVLCQELSVAEPTSPSFAVYLLDLAPRIGGDGGNTGIAERFGPLPEGLEWINVFDPPDAANNGKPSGRTVIFADSHEAPDRVHWRKRPIISQRYERDSSIQTRDSESRRSSLRRDRSIPGMDSEELEVGRPEPVELEDDS